MNLWRMQWPRNCLTANISDAFFNVNAEGLRQVEQLQTF
jgi:hypothetical protein